MLATHAAHQVACMPADVVKTRLQNGQHRYDGVLQCCLAQGTFQGDGTWVWGYQTDHKNDEMIRWRSILVQQDSQS